MTDGDTRAEGDGDDDTSPDSNTSPDTDTDAEDTGGTDAGADGDGGDPEGRGTDAPTDAEVACFEAGIKFGSLYHQFAGTPVAPRSAASLSAAMAEAIENQPHCEDVRVRVDPDRVREAIDGPEAYTELTGTLVDVDLEVGYEGITVCAAMRTEEGYPRMRIERVGRDE